MRSQAGYLLTYLLTRWLLNYIILYGNRGAISTRLSFLFLPSFLPFSLTEPKPIG